MRIARIIVPSLVYHVTHRGNRRDAVFFDDQDRSYYCHWLDHYAKRHRLAILAYCLMKNHIHLVVEPTAAISIAATIHDVHRRHAVWINKRRGWSGHLWSSRYYSTPLDSAHFRHAVRYVELNPVRAGVVAQAEEYRWSSAIEHSGFGSSVIQLATLAFPEVMDWSAWLAQGLLAPDQDAIRRNTYTGRPSGDEEFTLALESKLGRPLAPRRRGRPRSAALPENR